MPDEFCLILTSSSPKEAQSMAEMLVARHLAACVQMLPIHSRYLWEGSMVRDDEVLLLIKTRSELYVQVEAAILAAHSYDLPEIIQLPIERGYPPFLEWVKENTNKKPVLVCKGL